MDVTPMRNMKKLCSSVVGEWKIYYRNSVWGITLLDPASLFNITLTLSIPNHKMTLVPPEEFQAGALQDSEHFC